MLNLILIFLNYSLVLAYGITIACFFAGIAISKKNVCSFSLFFIIICCLQIILYILLGLQKVQMAYPFITHIPLILFLTFFFNKPIITSCAATLAAYLFTIPRKFIGTFFYGLLGDNNTALYLAQILATIPILYLTYKFIAPSMKKIFSDKGASIIFSAFSLLCYLFSYATTVYTNILYGSGNVAVEFLTSMFVISTFLFLVLYNHEIEKRLKTEHSYNIMTIKTQQAELSINSMKESQRLTIGYRHDLRHHLNYIKTCISNGKISEAEAYINELYKSFDDVKIQNYCQNTDANLVLSYFVSLAQASDIKIEINANVPENIALSSTDLCIILSNLLENAINACLKIDNIEDRKIYLSSSIKDNKFFLKISNSFVGEVKIENGMPVTDRRGHGVGVFSIAQIVKKHRGTFSYDIRQNIFSFKMLI